MLLMQHMTYILLYLSLFILQALELWTCALNGPLPNALQKAESQTLRTAFCDCLAAVGPNVLLQLPVRLMLHVVILL